MAKYFTGNPCPKGHLAGRYTHNGACVLCVKESNAKRRKERYHQDPEYKASVVAKVVERAKINPEQRRARANRCYAKNKENYRDRRNAQRSFRRRLTKQAMPPWMSAKQLAPIYKEAREKGLTVDHIVPLAGDGVCGLHVPWNLQLMTLGDNIKKGNRYVSEA